MSDFPTIELPPTAGQPPQGPLPKHSRRRWIAWAAGLTAFALALSLTLYFVLRGDSGQPAAANPSASQSATVSAPPVVPSPSASGNASHTPSTTGKAAPDGRIPVDVLKNATLVIPPWPRGILPSGPLKFTNGMFEDPSGDGTRTLVLNRVVYGDVDRDGATETVAAVNVLLAGGGQQLLAFDRDSAGRIVTLGAVLSTTGPVRQFETNTFRVESTGVITVRVADYAGCCGDETQPLWQWRSYGWNGRGFHQVSGPTAFPVNPQVTETAISTGDLVLSPATDGTRHGTVTVKVSYLYGAVPDHLMLLFSLTPDLQRDGTAWPPVRPWQGGQFSIDVPCPAARASATYVFAFKQTPISGTSPGMSVELFGVNKTGDLLSDADQWDNTASLNARIVG